MEKTIRFYGTHASLLKWRNTLMEAIGREGTGIREEDGRYFFEVKLNAAQRQIIQEIQQSGVTLEVVRKPN